MSTRLQLGCIKKTYSNEPRSHFEGAERREQVTEEGMVGWLVTANKLLLTFQVAEGTAG
jgi:hypothetical protein